MSQVKEKKVFPVVSVIMPICNEADFVDKAIRSVLANDYPSDKIEILVIDGMSDDGTREIVNEISQQDERVKLYDNTNKIVPFAMNIGLKAMKGDLFTRVDGHAEIAPDFIKNSVSVLEEQKDAWIVGGSIETVAKGYIGNAIAAAMQSSVGVGNSMFRLGDYEGWVDTLAFGMHHKWILDKIGLFDETLVRNQDDEFNMRVLLAGGKIWISKSINSKYYSRSSLKKLWRQYYQYGFWRIKTIQKHKKPATLRQLAPMLLVASILGLAMLGFLWSGFWLLLIAEVGLYSLGLLFGIFDVTRKVSWRYSPISPLIFMILHFGYGLGSMWGFIRFILLKGAGLNKPVDYKLSR